MNVETQIGERLRRRGWTISVAESCTAGLVGYRLTSVSGSSAYFKGGIIAYENDVKARELGVSSDDLAMVGAVSETVAVQMATGVRRRFGTTLGTGVTGIAGPGGGTAEKPVGTVFVAVDCDGRTACRKYVFEGNREDVRRQSADAVLALVVESLTEEGEEDGQS